MRRALAPSLMLVGALVAIGLANPLHPAPQTDLHLVAQVTPSEFRTVLDELKLTYKEDRDAEGTAVFNLAGFRDPVQLSLRRDGNAGFVTSIEATTTFTVKDKLSVSAANDWNNTNRFARCSIDADGRPILATDWIVGNGVTHEGLLSSVGLYTLCVRKFEAETLGKRGL